MNDVIVVEISKNWPEQVGSVTYGKSVANLFEDVIATNFGRGYRLRDWKFNRDTGDGIMIETIIAVFDRIV